MSKSPLVSILTPSFNKHEFVADAVESVLDQTFKNYEYWIVDNSTDDQTRPILRDITTKDDRITYLEFDFTQKERQEFYIPAYIINQVYTELEGKYIFYLSDDDIIYPNCLKHMVTYMKKHPEAWVCYHSMEYLEYDKGTWKQTSTTLAEQDLGLNTDQTIVDCKLDGGQILHKKACLTHLTYPYMPESLDSANHCDGLFMQRLANRWTFHAIPQKEILSSHRSTPKSTWIKPSSLRK